MVRSLTLLSGIVLVIGLGAMVWAGPRHDLPRPCPNGCVPNVGNFGYFTTTWRQWPGERRPEQDNPIGVGREPIPTPEGHEQLPLPPVGAPSKPPAAAPNGQIAPPQGGMNLPPERSPMSDLPPEPAPAKPSQPPAQDVPPVEPIPPIPPSEQPKEQAAPNVTPPSPPKDNKDKPTAWRSPVQQTTRVAEPVENPVVSPRGVVSMVVGAEPLRNDLLPGESHASSIAEAPASATTKVEPTSFATEDPVLQPEPLTSIVVPPVVLNGYCVVELARNGRWTAGDLRWTVVYRGGIYRFSGPTQRQQFLANPDAFAPVNSGNDPVVSVEENRSLPGRPAYCAMYDGRLYMFSNAATQTRFNQSPQRYAARK